MDFFRGLDNAPYSMFKTDYINGSNWRQQARGMSVPSPWPWIR
jgi:hypothetical protein